MDNEMKQILGLILNKIDGIDTRLDGIDKRLDGIDKRLDGIEARQDEMYKMQRALEENIKVTRAEQEKMMYMLVDIQGKVTKLSKEVETHENVISQLRAIK